MKIPFLNRYLVVLLLVLCGAMSLQAEDGDGGNIGATRVYCYVTQSWWTSEGATVGLYAYADGDVINAAWPGVRMTQEETPGLWSANIDPNTYSHIIFTRMAPATGGENQDWGAQTANLSVPTSATPVFVITSSTAAWSPETVTGYWTAYDADGNYNTNPNAGGDAASYFLTGSFNTWSLGDALPMDGDSAQLTLPAGTYSFKVLVSNVTWDGAMGYNSYNPSCSIEGVTTDEDGNIVVTLTDTGILTFRVEQSAVCVRLSQAASQGDEYVYSLLGTSALFGTDWDYSDTRTELTLQGENMYTYVIDSVALQTGVDYEYKVVTNHMVNVREWPSIEGGDNYHLSVEESGVYQVLFSFDPSTGCNATTMYLHAIATECTTFFASGECGIDGDNLTWTISCDGVLTISGSGAMANYNGSSQLPWHDYLTHIRTAIISEGVTSLSSSSTFEGCTNLVSVIIPEGIISLGDYTFSDCSSLRTVDLPSPMTSLGSYCFSNCAYIDSIICRADTPPTANGSTFAGVNYMIPIYVPTNTSDLYRAANGWDGFTDYREMEGITPCTTPIASGTCGAEGDSTNVFWELTCDSILFIRGTGAMADYYDPSAANPGGDFGGDPQPAPRRSNINKSRKALATDYAPWHTYNQSIKSIRVEEGVTRVGDNSFNGLSTVKSVSLPSTLQSVGEYAFNYLISLDTLTCGAATPPTTVSNSFYDVNSAATLQVPTESVSAYQAADGWKSFAKIQAIGSEAQTALSGIYRIGGEAADFASLHEAAEAVRTNGMSGNVTLLVSADLQESANVGLTNTSEYTLTIAPDAAVKRTITFGDAPDNQGPSGHVIIGYPMWDSSAANVWESTDTRNVIIDGSIDGEGQYLEFQAGSVGGVVVVFYGYVTNSVVRNCRLINSRTTSSNYVVQLRSEKNTDKAPIEVGFENCYMQVTGATNGQAIYFNGSQSATDAGKPTDCYIRNCEIYASNRGVLFNGAQNAIFENNVFSVINVSNGFMSHAILGNLQKGTIIVRGNKFIQLVTSNTTAGSYGIQGVTASGGADVWVIENNTFAGMNATAEVSDKSIQLLYVRCGDSCVVRHNTFYMPSLTHKPSTGLVASQTIGCVHLAGSKQYIVKNNIFVSEETEAYNSLIRGDLNANVRNNVFYHHGGNAAVLAGVTTAMTWEDFTDGDTNLGSVWANPQFVNAAEGNLALSIGNAEMKMPRLDDVLTDIEGTTRAEMTYAGAYEYTGSEEIIPCTTPIASGTCGADGDNLTWEINCDSVLVISGTGAMKDYNYEGAGPWDNRVVKMAVIEQGVTTIGANAFNNCTLMDSVSIPEGVDTIGEQAFRSCAYIDYIDLPASVKYIGNWAFAYCSYIDSLICRAFTPPTLVEEPFYNIPADVPLYVPVNSIAAYQAAPGWDRFTNFIGFESDEPTQTDPSNVMVVPLSHAWTFIMIPGTFGMNPEDIVTEGDVQWATYNGSVRAMGSSGWENYDAASAHMCSQALIVRATGDTATLTITVPEQAKNMSETTITLIDYPSVHQENANWNFIGNPYPYNYDIMSALDDAGFESPITVWNGVGYMTYTPGLDSYTLQPFETFFIQIPDGGQQIITFKPMYIEGGIDSGANGVVDAYGALPGRFSVSDSKQIQFSRGNLQYRASSQSWRFADNQYDVIGEANANISETYNGWIDLFGWGTGGNPTLVSTTNSDYSTFVDWGTNTIKNGGKEANMWYTLTKNEWVYLFNTRANATTLWGLGTVNGMNGAIVLPDDWSGADNIVFQPGKSEFSKVNVYDLSEWAIMERAGAVFLPIAGYRNGEKVIKDLGTHGYYWSATRADSSYGYNLWFYSNFFSPNQSNSRFIYGNSVRLVK